MQEKSQRPPLDQYELSLAEFPIFNLSNKQVGKDIKSIIYRDTIMGKDGMVISREWLVTPTKEYDFGTISTMDTFFTLFQIWKEQGFASNEIHYGSIRNILKRRNLEDVRENYDRIIRDLNCLTGLMITASNAFYDSIAGRYVTESFHIIDNLFFYEDESRFKRKNPRQEKLPFAKVKVNDTLCRSVKANLLLLDHDQIFWNSLTGVEKRLYLYLSKVLKTKAIYKREVLELASQIPIQAKEAKKRKQTLKDGCNGLIKKGFKLLSKVEFVKAADGVTDMIVFIRNGTPWKGQIEKKGVRKKEQINIECLIEDILDVCGDEKSKPFYVKVARLLDERTIYRTISEVKAAKNEGEIKKSPGQLFTFLIKKYAEEDGIEL